MKFTPCKQKTNNTKDPCKITAAYRKGMKIFSMLSALLREHWLTTISQWIKLALVIFCAWDHFESNFTDLIYRY